MSRSAFAVVLAAVSGTAFAQAGAGLRGRLTDAKTGEPLLVCPVSVISGGNTFVETDLEGNYELSLPPGTYDVRFWCDQYEGVDVKGVKVADGFLQRDLALKPVEGSFVEEVVVIGTVDTQSESGLLLQRKMANTVQDSIGSEQISRSPDSNAGDAVKRVTSATVVGRNVFLRGLGGRYAATVVNGVSLPSTDPDGHQAPLDLFPNALLSTLTVQKTYSAELGGAFAGGVLGIETNSYPATFQAQVKLSLGVNSESTFHSRRSYEGGSLDGLGIDDGSRGLPESVPEDRALTTRDSQAEEVSESFSNVWSSRRSGGLPNGGLSVSVGNTHQWGGGRAFGYLASATFSRSAAATNADVQTFRIDEQELIPKDLYRSEFGATNTNLGALLNAGYQWDALNDVSLLALFSRSTEDSAQYLSGFSDTDGANFDATRLKFAQRMLSFNQLRGTHRFGTEGAVLRWQGNVSVTHAEEPDTRDLLYLEDDGVRRFRQAANSGERFFSTLSDTSGGASVSLRVPVGRVEFTTGASAQLSQRRFDARRFAFLFVGEDPALLSLPAEEMFSAENLGPSFLAEERTFLTDRYDGFQSLYAGFASAELPLAERLRAVAGVRVEVFSQQVDSGSPFAQGQAPESTDRTTVNPLPALNLVYGLTDKANLRAGYSFTVARPQFREIAPFLYYDAIRRRSVSGNPDLVSSRIHNADLRWEWFPTESEVFSVGGFYKHFIDPIEQVVVSSIQGDVGYRNADGADALGLELEGRASLGRVSPVLSPLRVGANLSLIASRVNLGSNQQISTSESRPLQGQSPYVANVNVSYTRESSGTEVSVLYNVFGRRISEVGFNRLPDTYEQPFHRVDLALTQQLSQQLRLKLTGTNLLNQAAVFRQLGTDVFRYRPGLTATAQVEWSPL
ncbi:TonB-dependent receptor domain-containing protein [Hyalangium minutum]|uniref:TonB-dependent receptor n=1 Tax=Hyalangium minutum TaxID=394096 RepID=A0A085WFH5_9BACT|nr:TonB-dependent receptor [Hyalangium minutum]KFE66438.1 TonB-dependent receptor [Hyalangium minutum]